MELKPTGTEDWVATRAMIDCGGQGSFINEKFSHYHRLPSRIKTHPVSLVLADGSQSQAGNITQYNPLSLRTAGNEEPLSLDVAPMTHDVILGMPWLRKHDPAIRFGRRTLTFDSPFCEQHCGHYGETLPLHISPHTPKVGDDLGEEKIQERDAETA